MSHPTFFEYPFEYLLFERPFLLKLTRVGVCCLQLRMLPYIEIGASGGCRQCMLEDIGYLDCLGLKTVKMQHIIRDQIWNPGACRGKQQFRLATWTPGMNSPLKEGFIEAPLP